MKNTALPAAHTRSYINSAPVLEVRNTASQLFVSNVLLGFLSLISLYEAMVNLHLPNG